MKQKLWSASCLLSGNHYHYESISIFVLTDNTKCQSKPIYLATVCSPFRQRKLKHPSVTISHISSKPLSQQSFTGGQHQNPIATGWISTFFPAGFCGSISRWSPDHPLPPIAPPCCSVQTFLFCISLVFHIPVFAQLCCPLWNLVHWELCANVLQRTVLNSNYACVQPLHTHTQTYRDIQWW